MTHLKVKLEFKVKGIGFPWTEGHMRLILFGSLIPSTAVFKDDLFRHSSLVCARFKQFLPGIFLISSNHLIVS